MEDGTIDALSNKMVVDGAVECAGPKTMGKGDLL